MLRKVAFFNGGGGGLKLGKKLVRMWWYLLNSLYTTEETVSWLFFLQREDFSTPFTDSSFCCIR